MASLSTLFREKFDRIILGVGIVVLLLSLGIIGLGMTRAQSQKPDPVPEGQPVADLNSDAMQTQLAALESSTSFSATNLVLISEPRIACINPDCRKLIRADAAVCPFCGAKQPVVDDSLDSDGDGMTDKYELAHGLDRMFPDGEYDLDGDGFTNKEEYDAGTAANDPDSYPPLIAKVRVSRTLNRPILFRLKGLTSSGGARIFQVNIESLDNTLFLKEGDTHKGYTVKSYNPQKSILTLESPERTIDLPNGKQVEVPRRVAQIVNIIRPQFMTNVTVGTAFEVDDVSYEVKDILQDSLVVTYAKTQGGKTTLAEATIPRELPEEKDFRAAGGKYPSGPQQPSGTSPQAPQGSSASPAWQGQRTPTPAYNSSSDQPGASSSGFSPPPPGVLERLRDARRQ